MNPLQQTRRWLGPLGRYRPSVFRRDMLRDWEGEAMALPGWLQRLWPEWSSPEERLLEALPFRGQVVYDVGAFQGAYALFFSRRVGPAGLVVACEPQTANFAELARRLERQRVSNVRAVPLALGESAGVRTLFALPGMATTASLASEARTLFRRAVGTAQVTTLDGLLAALHLPAPDFIKIDVEGHELEVLRGGEATLARHHPALLIEVHGIGRAAKTVRVQAIVAMLNALNYSVVHVESGRMVEAGRTEVRAGHLYACANGRGERA